MKVTTEALTKDIWNCILRDYKEQLFYAWFSSTINSASPLHLIAEVPRVHTNILPIW